MTENVETLNTVSLTMASGDMLNLLGNSFPFTAKNSPHHALEFVNLMPGNATIEALATDQYRIARAELPLLNVTGDLDGVRLLLHRTAAEQFTKALKPLKRELAKRSDLGDVVDLGVSAHQLATLTATIAVALDRRYVSAWKLEWHGGSSQVSNELNSAVDFPRIKQLITDIPAGNDAFGLLVFNPALMATFMKVTDLTPGKSNIPMAVIGAEDRRKPMTIQYGDWFTGLLMPVKEVHQGFRYGAPVDHAA
ncbi:hypothetical protein [Glutamicibacter uratoxydans]|nr:hypothetical protein [Glutamicibacter uratoxydans]